ncbi:MAG: BtaA family protein [Pirellulales bacterium]|nr:BtaA family protein [Pirellulales bacterium]
MRLWESFQQRCFHWVHGSNLVYNACWEDPRLDRVALQLGPADTVAVITSAGCNALDYVLQSPRAVYTIDMNPRQNALLELKLAGIRALDYETFFRMFGQGKVANPRQVYEQQLRRHLSPVSQKYWDRFHYFFSGRGFRPSFYFHGTAGAFARGMNFYIDRLVRLRGPVQDLLAAGSVAEQRDIYERQIKPVFWSKPLRWALGRNSTLSMLGVPPPQVKQVEKHFGGIAGFMQSCVEAVFAELPIADNYFWRVYLTGSYTPDCCPEYLKPENFAKLQGGLVDRVRPYTGTVEEFLLQHPEPLTRLILLDHMDWLSTHRTDLLRSEWQAIVERAAPGARILWRSGGLETPFVDEQIVQVHGRNVKVGELLTYNKPLAEELHRQDRVHTYGCFNIAELAV